MAGDADDCIGYSPTSFAVGQLDSRPAVTLLRKPLMTTWPRALAVAALLMISRPALAQGNGSGLNDNGAAAGQSAFNGRGIYVAASGGLVLSQLLRADAGVSAELDDGYMALGAVGGARRPLPC